MESLWMRLSTDMHPRTQLLCYCTRIGYTWIYKSVGIYPPTPADARGSAPGNNTFGCLCTPCSISTAAGRPCLTQFFYGFRRHGRHVRQFLGYILSLFRPSLPLRFPVREGCLCSISSTRQQHQQQPSTSTPCSISTAQQQEGDVWHSSSTVLDDTLDTFWARFWRCSVL